jgi:hypothetical protein
MGKSVIAYQLAGGYDWIEPFAKLDPSSMGAISDCFDANGDQFTQRCICARDWATN